MTSQDKFIAWAEKNMPTLHLERSEVSGHFVSPVTGNFFKVWTARDGEVEALNEFHSIEMSGVERAKQMLAEKLGCADEPRWKWLLMGADDLIREREKLRAECEALRKDSERLEFIMADEVVVCAHAGSSGMKYWLSWPVQGESQIGAFDSPRDAIDAAMSNGGDQ